jgi:hypothetical protein
VRAINTHGVTAVAMLFVVVPAVAGVLSWIILDQRADGGIAVGLVLGGLACWINSRASAGCRPASRSMPTTPLPQIELQDAPR